MSYNNNNNNNTTRRILINNYLNAIDENNSNISQLINLMNNQENTLRRLIFENDIRPRTSTTFTPFVNNFTTNTTNTTNRASRVISTNTNLTTLNRPRDRYIESLASIDNLLDTFLEPINVAPTREQIDRATRHTIYSDIDNPINTTCPIALRRFDSDDEVTVIRHCNHVFCRDDLESWFRANTRCPLCRYDIRTYVNREN